MLPGRFSVYPADRNLALPAGAAPLQPKKLWLIVKELRTGNHQLQELDVIKLGRFKLRVKQLVKSGTTPPVGLKSLNLFVTEKFEFICEEIVAAKNDLLFTVCVTGSSRCLAYTRFFSQEHASAFFHGFFFVK